jgi:hypothetical protein
MIIVGAEGGGANDDGGIYVGAPPAAPVGPDGWRQYQLQKLLRESPETRLEQLSEIQTFKFKR